MTISLSIALVISLIISLIMSYYIIQAIKNRPSGDWGDFSLLFIVFILIIGGFALSLNWLIYFIIN